MGRIPSIWSDDYSNPMRDYFVMSGGDFYDTYGVHQGETEFINGELYKVETTTKWMEYDGVADETSYEYSTTITKVNDTNGGSGFADGSDNLSITEAIVHYNYGGQETVDVCAQHGHLVSKMPNYSRGCKSLTGEPAFVGRQVGEAC